MATHNTQLFTVGVDQMFLAACQAGSFALTDQAEGLASRPDGWEHYAGKIMRLREQARLLDEFVKAARLHIASL